MFMTSKLCVRLVARQAGVFILAVTLSGCFFFRKRESGGKSAASSNSTVLGTPLGDRAGSADEAALQELYALTSPHAPAGIRPDPDVMVRRLLRQYRDEGATVAREIGRVEQFRLLLGGANEDFTTNPQETYDATSLLASYKVAEEVCIGLVDPRRDSHGDWETILPASPSDLQTNLLFLAQRFMGRPSEKIDSSVITQLSEIVRAGTPSGSYSYASYIPACAALAIDAESLLL